MSKAYLYSPEGLAENFRKLKQEEDELVKARDLHSPRDSTRLGGEGLLWEAAALPGLEGDLAEGEARVARARQWIRCTRSAAAARA